MALFPKRTPSDNADQASPRPRRLRRILKWVAGLVVVLPLGLALIAVAGLLVFANIPYGQKTIEREVASLTGDMVHIEGLKGAFPYNLRIRHLAIQDRIGTYLTIEGLHLHWSPLALIHLSVHASVLEADSLHFDRLPVSDPAPASPPEPASGPSGLHLAIRLDAVRVGNIDIGKALAGFPLSAMLYGHLSLGDLARVLDGITLAHLPVADIGLDLRRLDRPGSVSLALATPRDRADLHLAINDGKDGIMTQLAGLPALAPLAVSLDLNGPVHTSRISLSAQAGALKAGLRGQADLLAHRGHLSLSASSPAMTPVPGVAWSRLALAAELDGNLLAPTGNGTLDLDTLSAGGAGLNHLAVSFDGSKGGAARKAGDTASGPQTDAPHERGENPRPAAGSRRNDTASADRIAVALRADGLRIPGVPPALLARAPLTARISAEPNAPGRPVTLAVAHPLLQLSGRATLEPDIRGALDLILPELAPLASVGGLDLVGHSVTHADFTYRKQGMSSLVLTDRLAVTGGMKQASALIGDEGAIRLEARAEPLPKGGNRVHIDTLEIEGKAIHLRDHGEVSLGDKPQVVNDLSVSLPELERAAAQLHGEATLKAHVEGPFDDFSALIDLDGKIGAHGVPKGPLSLGIVAHHLPSTPEGTIKAHGMLDAHTLALDASFARHEDKSADLELGTLDWASVKGKGHLRLPDGAKLPLGDLSLKAMNLADFSALLGQRLGGHVALDIRTSESDAAHPPVVTLALKGAIRTDQARLGALDLGGTVGDPIERPDLDLRLALDGIEAQGMTGRARLGAKGTLDALSLTLDSAFRNVMGAPASLATALVLDLPERRVRLDRLEALVKGETLHLSGPSRIAFGDEMGVDRLRLTVAPRGVSPASLDLAGSIKPRLDLHMRLAQVTPALARPFMPSLDATGTLGAQADLTGTLSRPSGHASLVMQGIQMRTGPAASLPPLAMKADATLTGDAARVDVRADAGRQIALRVNGRVPVDPTGAMALGVKGGVDLAVANPVLGAQGMALDGRTDLDLTVTGTLKAPQASGRIQLSGIDFTHYGQGVRLSDINGTIVASNDSFTLQNVLAHAGKGTIGLAGSVGALRPGLPIDLHITANKAQPVTSDLLTAVIDMDLRAHGQLSTRLDVDGTIRLPSVVINIPNSMPASVPQLDVVRPGQKRERSGPALVVGLDVNVVSPGSFFVRGHGLDAEMSGKLHVGGLSTSPDISGGFDLRRGFFNLAGVNLNFTKGRVAFDGSGVNHKLDPSLDFRADRNVQGTLASLVVGGYASEPRIDFTSVPSLPRDQVLSMLLFGSSTASLSTTQLAELATAVAQISGVSSFDPLGKVRGLLGLDRLAVGGGSGVNNGGASLEAGKYVMRGVYVGAKQATSGSGTQAQVQVDLTKRLKLNTTVGTGGQVTGFTTPENDPGSSVGLSYGFDY